ncbi:putative heparinase superfamily protein [Stenotrophomonas sp. 1337]|nr:putative heparinase superfamily protein [Stenotrophomonas sp. 1337]
MLDGQFAELAQGGLAALAGIRSVLEHEHAAPDWGNLAQKAGYERIVQFDRLCQWAASPPRSW